MRVLLVEDHPIYSAGFQTILRRLDPGMQAVTAATAERALELCPEDPEIPRFLERAEVVNEKQ